MGCEKTTSQGPINRCIPSFSILSFPITKSHVLRTLFDSPYECIYSHFLSFSPFLSSVYKNRFFSFVVRTSSR